MPTEQREANGRSILRPTVECLQTNGSRCSHGHGAFRVVIRRCVAIEHEGEYVEQHDEEAAQAEVEHRVECRQLR